MEQIIKDLNDLYWWFNIGIALLLFILGFLFEEFVLKPIVKSTKTYLKQRRKTKEGDAQESIIIAELKSDPVKEQRMQFRLLHVKQAIWRNLIMICITIVGSSGLILVYDFLPVKVVTLLYGSWMVISTSKDLLTLIEYQNYFFRILKGVEKAD